jgi:hemerythrin superfamily protein
MPQIYDVLKQDHREIEQMLKQMATGKADGKMFGQLTMLLTAHTKAEEKAVYPDLLKPKATKGMTLEGIEEHHVAEFIMKEMQKLDPKDERFKAKMSVLQENVQHHIREEEKVLFPQAKKAMQKGWAEMTAERFEQQEQTLKQKMGGKPAGRKRTTGTRAAAKPTRTTGTRAAAKTTGTSRTTGTRSTGTRAAAKPTGTTRTTGTRAASKPAAAKRTTGTRAASKPASATRSSSRTTAKKTPVKVGASSRKSK